jgi:transposase-like protein
MTDMVNKRRQSGTGKVVDAQVREAIQRYLDGEGVTSIARSLNVNKSTVYHWLDGKNRRTI